MDLYTVVNTVTLNFASTINGNKEMGSNPGIIFKYIRFCIKSIIIKIGLFMLWNLFERKINQTNIIDFNRKYRFRSGSRFNQWLPFTFIAKSSRAQTL